MIFLLPQAGDILIPPAVNLELGNKITGWHSLDWLSIHPLENDHAKTAQSWVLTGQLDPGEAEAVGLSLQMKANWLLTDDAQARRFAESLNLEVHGSVGLLLWAVAAGHLDDPVQAYAAMDALAGSSLWISVRVLREARRVINFLLAH
jgi:predicted nucleic acid-binding protein